MNEIARAIFALSPDVRYVATYLDGQLDLASRAATNASGSESDRYEELIVNPALLVLTRQRGEIDCGGLEYIVVRYGAFYALVVPVRGGHVAVSVEPAGNPLALVEGVRGAVEGARGGAGVVSNPSAVSRGSSAVPHRE